MLQSCRFEWLDEIPVAAAVFCFGFKVGRGTRLHDMSRTAMKTGTVVQSRVDLFQKVIDRGRHVIFGCHENDQ